MSHSGEFQEVFCDDGLCIEAKREKEGLFRQAYLFRSRKEGVSSNVLKITTGLIIGLETFQISAAHMNAKPRDAGRPDTIDYCVTLFGPLGGVQANFVAFSEVSDE